MSDSSFITSFKHFFGLTEEQKDAKKRASDRAASADAAALENTVEGKEVDTVTSASEELLGMRYHKKK